VKGGGVKTGRWDSVRRKECGRITCKRSESSRVSLKLQPLIKPVLSLDSVASLIATGAASFGIMVYCSLQRSPRTSAARRILRLRWSTAERRPYKGHGRLKEAGESLVGN
jgi:hypothetical protein